VRPGDAVTDIVKVRYDWFTTVPHFCPKVISNLSNQAKKQTLKSHKGSTQWATTRSWASKEDSMNSGKQLKMQSTSSAKWVGQTANDTGMQDKRSSYIGVKVGTKSQPCLPIQAAPDSRKPWERNQKLFTTYSPTTFGTCNRFIQLFFPWAYV
jgi:hypothetical protein